MEKVTPRIEVSSARLFRAVKIGSPPLLSVEHLHTAMVAELVRVVDDGLVAQVFSTLVALEQPRLNVVSNHCIDASGAIWTDIVSVFECLWVSTAGTLAHFSLLTVAG